MVVVAQFLGLRVSEILVLKWADIDFQHLTAKVQRGAVHGRIDMLKTEYSEDELPLAPEFAAILQDWRSRCQKTAGDWVFPSHLTGEPFHASPIQQDYIRPAGCAFVPCPKCHSGVAMACKDDKGRAIKPHEERYANAGPLGHVGWHTFRHTYRSWLDDGGAPIGVQQKLMRHAQVSTTMNVYGNALMESKRKAQAKVVEMGMRRTTVPSCPQPASQRVN